MTVRRTGGAGKLVQVPGDDVVELQVSVLDEERRVTRLRERALLPPHHREDRARLRHDRAVDVEVRVRLPRHEEPRVHREVLSGVREEAADGPAAVPAHRDVDVREEPLDLEARVDDEHRLGRVVVLERLAELLKRVVRAAHDLHRRRLAGDRRTQRDDRRRAVGLVRARDHLPVARLEDFVERSVPGEDRARGLRAGPGAKHAQDAAQREPGEGGAEAGGERAADGGHRVQLRRLMTLRKSKTSRYARRFLNSGYSIARRSK